MVERKWQKSEKKHILIYSIAGILKAIEFSYLQAVEAWVT